MPLPQEPLPQLIPPPLPHPLWLQSEIKENPLIFSVDEGDLEAATQRLLSSDSSLKGVFYLRNFALSPQLQVGPKCGLVALSIATSITKNFVNVNVIFEMALAHGFTKQGEIFDANHLAILADKLGFKTKILNGGLKSHLSCILEGLLNRCLLLVPYDADFNHAPCCKEGFRAHWGVISGFVIMEEKSEGDEDNDVIELSSPKCTTCEADAVTDQSLYFSIPQRKVVLSKKGESTFKTCKKGRVYVVGLQGKSRHIGLWSFDEMATSNNNLIYFPPSRSREMYVVPDGGVAKGLKGRAVFLEYPGTS